MGADWDAAETGAHRLHGDGFVDSIASTRTGPGVDNECEVPEPVLDALVELAWSFPNLRVSYARLCERRVLQFLACAGADDLPKIDGWRLDISRQRKFYDALRTSDIPILIEDTSVDGRTRGVAADFAAQGSGSMVIFPLRHDRGEPSGLLMLDSKNPRTWSAKEAAALERVGPLVLLGLDHARICVELQSTKAKAAEYERRLGGASGLAAGVLHDTRLLMRGLMNVIASSQTPAGESATTLGRQLEAVLGELSALDEGHTKAREPQTLDLNTVIDEMMPGLRVLAGPNVRMLTHPHPGRLLVSAHRAGLERLVVNLLVATHERRSAGNSIVLETGAEQDMAYVMLYGDGLRMDDALSLLDHAGAAATVDELGMGLWLVRTEALLNDVKIRVWSDTGGQLRIRVSLAMVS